VTSNARKLQVAYDKETTTTWASSEDNESSREGDPRGTGTIPHMTLPFGGRATNKISEKWKRKIRNRNGRKAEQSTGYEEYRNRRTSVISAPTLIKISGRTKHEAWMNIVKECSNSDVRVTVAIDDN